MLPQVNPSSDNDRFGGGLEEATEEVRRSPSPQSQPLPPHQDPQRQSRVQTDHPKAQPDYEPRDHHPSCVPPESSGQGSIAFHHGLQPESESRVPDPDVCHLHQHAPSPAVTSPRPHRRPQTRLKSVFRGSDLVDWLLQRGLCAGRGEAQIYGARLQRGGVLDHLTGQHRFRDEAALLYYFSQRTGRWTTTNE